MKEYPSYSKLKTILSKDPISRPQDWDGFFEAVAHLHSTHDFLTRNERELPTQDKDPFDGLVNQKP